MLKTLIYLFFMTEVFVVVAWDVSMGCVNLQVIEFASNGFWQ